MKYLVYHSEVVKRFNGTYFDTTDDYDSKLKDSGRAIWLLLVYNLHTRSLALNSKVFIAFNY